jgi:very-short-patch-repair endonuclease/predicted transcriptional regulator of viral defense system
VASEGNVGAEIPTERSPRREEAAIATLAARQHGVISRAQLTALGLGAGAIKHRIGLGRLHPLYRGIYAVGHRSLTREAGWMAAVLAARPDSVLSHLSAAGLWGVRDSRRAVVEVTAPRKLRARAGIEVHRVVLAADEVTVERGIPVTTPARTLFDLAAVVSLDQLEHAFNEAEYRRLTSPVSLDGLLARYPGRRGTKALRRVLQNHRENGETRTRSDLERALISLVDAHGLPRPKINPLTNHGELDAMRPDQRLIVECDGFAAHGTRKAFEDDRARDRALVVAGWRVIRLTWRQLTTEPDTIAEQLRSLLSA